MLHPGYVCRVKSSQTEKKVKSRKCGKRKKKIQKYVYAKKGVIFLLILDATQKNKQKK